MSDSKIPKYKQLTLQIYDSIRKNYRIGDYLMPETKLASKYAVNRHTIRHALDELEAKGVISRVPGKGTLVTSAPIIYEVNRETRLTSKLEELGYETKIINLGKYVLNLDELEDLEIQHKLQLSENEQVIRIRTLRYASETPISFIEHFLSIDRFPKIQSRYGKSSLQNFLKSHYQIECERVHSTNSAVQADDEIAKALNIASSDSVLCIKTLNRNLAGDKEPVELSISYNRADCLQMNVSYI